MVFSPGKIAIIGATGPTGIHLTSELSRRGHEVRVVSRSLERLRSVFPEQDVEAVEADALDPRATRRALEGCDTVVDCIGLPADRITDHPATATVVANVVKTTGARCLQVSSYWSYLPQERPTIDESHPRRGGNVFIRSRREAEDILRAAGAAIVHLPDFFGPHVRTGSLQLALEEIASGKAMSWIGSPSVARDYTYVPDAMRTVAALLEREEAYGQDWGLAGSGPLSAATVAGIAGHHLGRTVRVRAAAPWVLHILALFSSGLRSFMPMVPHYAVPVSYDASRLHHLLGDVPATSYDEAIPVTLDWLRAPRPA
jgi:nucleoside-diphosphate-sugar epimerase